MIVIVIGARCEINKLQISDNSGLSPDYLQVISQLRNIVLVIVDCI